MLTLCELGPNDVGGDVPLWYYGDGRYRLHVPSVLCPICGPGGGRWKRVILECPTLVAKEIEAVYAEGANISPSEFSRYEQRWSAVLREHGFESRLEPGDDLTPFEWWLPTIPRYSIFWMPFEIIISAKLADSFRSHEVTGVSFSKVVLKRVGMFEVTDPIPEWLYQQSNENDDFLDLVPAMNAPDSLGQFWLMIPHFNSSEVWYQEIADQISVCATCGRRSIPRELEIERNKERSRWRKKNELPANYTFPVDIFRSHIYDHGIVVSEKVMNLLDESDLRNCHIREINVVA